MLFRAARALAAVSRGAKTRQSPRATGPTIGTPPPRFRLFSSEVAAPLPPAEPSLPSPRHIGATTSSSPHPSTGSSAVEGFGGGWGLQRSSHIAGVSWEGERVSLDFDDGRRRRGSSGSTTATYHASWLWSNDPRGTVPSGQRTRTPGAYHRRRSRSSSGAPPKISSAEIVYLREIFGNDGSGVDPLSSSSLEVPGPTMSDCCHPLAVYGHHKPWIRTAQIGSGDNSKAAEGRQYLRIAWTDDAEDVSLYDVEWLLRFRYDDEALQRRTKSTEVTPRHAIRHDGRTGAADRVAEADDSRRGDGGLIRVDYESVVGGGLGDDNGGRVDGIFRLLDAVFRHGSAIVTGVPLPPSVEAEWEGNNNDGGESFNDDELPVARVARAMSGGAPSHGVLYGDIFHVRVGQDDSNNVAYTSSSLVPHQDLAYYESPPGIQLLHCVANGKCVVGGESTLIDALAAAHRLREVRPDSFEVLTKCPATFVKQRAGACMTYRRPHIVLAEGGVRGRSSASSPLDREIVAVFWSPPFEGPVCLSPMDVDAYYEAYADFERMVDSAVVDGNVRDGDREWNGDEQDADTSLAQYAREHTWQHKLRPGDMLVFNNRRMLHGRRGFSSREGANREERRRHLVGCYANIDDTLNMYRVLLRERILKSGGGEATDAFLATHILNVGNGTSLVP